jgi:hypothetical protein
VKGQPISAVINVDYAFFWSIKLNAYFAAAINRNFARPWLNVKMNWFRGVVNQINATNELGRKFAHANPHLLPVPKLGPEDISQRQSLSVNSRMH